MKGRKSYKSILYAVDYGADLKPLKRKYGSRRVNVVMKQFYKDYLSEAAAVNWDALPIWDAYIPYSHYTLHDERMLIIKQETNQDEILQLIKNYF